MDMANDHGQRGVGDTRYLEKHQGLWRVVVGYRHEGKVIKLRRSLGLGSLREAQRMRWPVVAQLKARLAGKAPTRTDEAEAWREAMAAGDGGPDDPTRHALSDHLDAIRGDPIATEADHDGNPVYLYAPEGERRATEFADQAYGRATPLTEHLPTFLASRGQLKGDTKARHEAAIEGLKSWLKRNHLPQTLQAVDRRTAIRYADQLPPGRPDPKRLSLYWAWLVKREHAPSDPWSGLSAPPRPRIEPERAFTDDEVRRLLSSPCSPTMLLLMKVAALTGARLDAIIRMEVKADTIILPPQKKERGPRTIPLHSSLARPLEGFAGWPYPNSMAASKAFTRHRRKVLGPDEPGRRRAVVNAHSFRRWFISQAERAGIDERIISDVVGHARRSMTGRYSAGATMEQMKVCVEAVKLPIPQARATP
jgi:integrase